MKSILIIGMGRFGHYLCKEFVELGNEVMIVDSDEQKINDVLSIVTSARIGDCTNVEVLKGLGVGNFDLCFVCIGSNFQSSLEITSLVKELGAKWVVSKANRDIQAKFLMRNGADEVIYSERDIAIRMAKKYSADHVFDYVELTDEYGIYEIPPLDSWIGFSIRESNIASEYKMNILGIRTGDGQINIMPSADYKIQREDHLMVVAHSSVIHNAMQRIK